MKLIGLTGGIASGKSTIAQHLASHGAIIVDADQVARDVVEPGTPALAALVDAFGAGIVREDGALDRAALGDIVFHDRNALAILSGITHPAVATESLSRIERARATDPDAVVVYDVPLLVEAGSSYPFELIVVAQADEKTRIERLVSLRGMSESEAHARIQAQATDAQRRAVADVLIDTSGTLDATHEQVDALWQRIAHE